MAFKFIVVLALAAVASAGHIAVDHSYGHYEHQPTYLAAPAVLKTISTPLVKHVEYEAPAKYDFSYGVHDPHSGDVKSQVESRDGDNVHGSYSLIDADGYKRTVDYTADEHNGFNAVVHREPIAHHAPVTKIVAAPIAPVTKVITAPATYSTGHYAPSHYAPAHYAPAHYAPAAYSTAHYAPVAKVAVAAPAHFTKVISPVAKVVAAPVHYAPVHTAYATSHHYDDGHYAGHYDGQYDGHYDAHSYHH